MTLPDASTPPLEGSFRIDVPVPEGGYVTTADIPYTDGQWAIGEAIYDAVPFWRFKTTVTLDSWASYRDRKNIWISFDGYAGDPAEFLLLDGDET